MSNTTTAPAGVVSSEQLGTQPERPKEAWGIAAAAPTQQRAAETHCFGDCGKISIGTAIADEETGGMFPCFQATCPYEQQTFRCYGSTVLGGVPHLLHLRVLRQQ